MPKRLVLLRLICVAAVLSPGLFCQQTTVDENVVYASINGSDLHLDIYKPAAQNAPRPGVILIHGGGWMQFDKSNMASMGRFLSRHGFVAFAVDYRLFDGKDNNRWPAQLDDAQRAVRWIRAHAAKYNVEPAHIGAYGHSAGGQIAALLGMEDTRDNSDPALAAHSSKVQAVVDVSGPSDFTLDHDADGNAFLNKFLGATYSGHPDIWREASPAFHAAKDNAPFLIVHGSQDSEVSPHQSQVLYDRLQAAGVPSSFVKVNDVHTFQTPEARRQLAIQTLAFFSRYLGVSAAN
jgi:acetyl esterase/lipase